MPPRCGRLLRALVLAAAWTGAIGGSTGNGSIAVAEEPRPTDGSGLGAVPPVRPAAPIEEGEEPASLTCAGGGRGGPPTVALRFTAPAHHGHLDCSALYVGISLRTVEPSWGPLASPTAPAASPPSDGRVKCH